MDLPPPPIEELLTSISNIESPALLISMVAAAHRSGASTAALATARKCGEPAIRHLLRLDRKLTNKAKDRLADRTISLGHARALIKWTDEARQNEMLLRCISEKWSVRTLESATNVRSSPDASDAAATEYARLAQHVATQTGYPCTFQFDKASPNAGKLQMSFESYAELDGILRRLRVNMDDWN